MKAIVRTRYGPPDVLQFTEIEKPAPKHNGVLISIFAAALNPLDRFHLRGAPWNRGIPGLSTPKQPVIGCDIAGRVEAAGKDATQFQPGDAVFGVTGLAGGAFAEYVCAPEAKLARKPVNISFEAAAAVPIAALTALQGLRDYGRIQPGQKVLIDGASGGVGTFAIQIAKSLGAEVTAVCSTRNLDMVRQIGADHIINYTQENFTKNGQRYDLIIAVNGNYGLLDYRRALSPNGIYVAVGGSIPQVIQGLLMGPLVSKIGSKKMGFMGITQINHQDLVVMSEYLAAGKVVPVIDRRYPLDETAEALRYLEKGHAKGKVVITVEHDNKT